MESTQPTLRSLLGRGTPTCSHRIAERSGWSNGLSRWLPVVRDGCSRSVLSGAQTADTEMRCFAFEPEKPLVLEQGNRLRAESPCRGIRAWGGRGDQGPVIRRGVSRRRSRWERRTASKAPHARVPEQRRRAPPAANPWPAPPLDHASGFLHYRDDRHPARLPPDGMKVAPRLTPLLTAWRNCTSP